ncbi:MAG TPA: NUDIX domain-containing protein [Marinilabiliaceae bacterium]|nr:NUDIX domain-containing protein [Marinilabiliaceae bacterium]
MDRKNRKYSKFPKYHVAVDCVIFGYEDGDLKLLLYHRGFEPVKGKWSLMGGFIKESESSDAAARRILHSTTGLNDVYLEQVQAFSQPKRDIEDRVISIAYFALIRIDRHKSNKVRESSARWWSVNDLPELIFDHKNMVNEALKKLQIKAEMELVGCELLPDHFTLLQLRKLYEAIFQKELDTGNFRKKVLSLKVLERLDKKNTTESRRGAYYFKFIKETRNELFDNVVKI